MRIDKLNGSIPAGVPKLFVFILIRKGVIVIVGQPTWNRGLKLNKTIDINIFFLDLVEYTTSCVFYVL